MNSRKLISPWLQYLWLLGLRMVHVGSCMCCTLLPLWTGKLCSCHQVCVEDPAQQCFSSAIHTSPPAIYGFSITAGSPSDPTLLSLDPDPPEEPQRTQPWVICWSFTWWPPKSKVLGEQAQDSICQIQIWKDPMLYTTTDSSVERKVHPQGEPLPLKTEWPCHTVWQQLLPWTLHAKWSAGSLSHWALAG